MGDISQSASLGQTIFNGPIAFPGLGLQLDPSKQVFGTFIHWYGVIIALGFLLAILAGMKLIKREGISQDSLLDIVIIGTPSAIVGARLYYVIFAFDQYKDNLLDIFKIWEGGLAIYGGIIGAVLSTAIYCHVKKIKLTKILDVGAVGLIIGQAVGRWGNFVNREAFGSHASSLLPWRMRLYTDATMSTWADVHPTFLYESLWCVGVLCVLLWLYRKKKFDEQIFLSYVLLYGVGRFWIEGLRTDSLYIGPIRVSQLLALLSAIAALVLLVWCYKRAKFGMYAAVPAADQNNAEIPDSIDATSKAGTKAEAGDSIQPPATGAHPSDPPQDEQPL